MACLGACGHRTSSSVWALITDSLGTSLLCWKRAGGEGEDILEHRFRNTYLFTY